MTRDDLREAADALGRLEALERALRSLGFAPHGALPVSFFDMGEDDDHQSDHGIKVYYPRDTYTTVITMLADDERFTLKRLGVEP